MMDEGFDIREERFSQGEKDFENALRPLAFRDFSSDINPSDVVQSFPMDDDYSFGILQSSIHWEWFMARCSILGGTWRYTSDTVFDSYPWPQNPTIKQIGEVAKFAKALRDKRSYYG